MVNFVDLARSHEPILPQILDAMNRVVTRGAFVNGEEIAKFESAYKELSCAPYNVATSSGLSAGVIGLRSLGLKPGEKVIVPAMTFIASVEAIIYAGGQPLFVDVDENGLIDLEETEKHLKAGVRWMLPVHLFGQLVNPEKIQDLIRKYEVRVVEDACQAHGARSKSWCAGNLGEGAFFSFYPAKNLGAFGDGGLFSTKYETAYKVAKALREHGQLEKNVYIDVGYTARLDTVQAAVLQVKLGHLASWTQQRIAAAKYYDKALSGMKDLRPQASVFNGSHVYHLYVVVTRKREELISVFKDKKIGYGLHYPVVLSKVKFLVPENAQTDSFKNAEMYATQGLSLPMYPGITESEMSEVVQAIRQVCT